MSAAHLSLQRRLKHREQQGHSVAWENEALGGSQLSQSRNCRFLQKPNPFLVLGGSRWRWSALPHVGASVVVMSPERQLGGSNQLLSRPLPNPHALVGRELRVRHIVRPDVDLGSNSLLFFLPEV